jgi:polar amino acid transport system substrate-binding protein
VHPLLPTLAALGALIAASAAAEPVTLEYSEIPPFSYVSEGQPSGPALTLARTITSGLGIPFRRQLVPIRRINFEAASAPLIVAAIVRTPQRDALYRWIGKLCSDPFVMVTRAPTPAVDSLDEARKLNLIAVVSGASNEALLLAQGLTNLDVAASIELEVRRLAEGHDDAWFAPGRSALFAWEAAGHDPAQLRLGAPVAPMEIWMAASKSVPEPVFQTLRDRFAEQVRSGAVAAVTGCPE